MSADPLPWSEVLRRRNGLPPDHAGETAGDRVQRLIAEHGPVATEDDPQIVITDRQAALWAAANPPDLLVTITADATAAMRGLDRCAAACERRCPHDLPTTMCHHCKEI